MKLTMEMPARGKDDVVGLSRAENEQFWMAEDEFNSLYGRIQNGFIVLAWLVFDVQLFMVSFDVEIVVYIVFQTFHMFNGNFFIWNFLFTVYTLNVFFIECLLFVAKKFRRISQKVQHLRASKTQRINNQRLARLIYEYCYDIIFVFKFCNLNFGLFVSFKGTIKFTLSWWISMDSLRTS